MTKEVWRRFPILAVALLGALGCNNEDVDHLSRVAGKVVNKFEPVAQGANGRLSAGWRALHSDLDELALDARVSARLHWDKGLADCHIKVSTDGTTVRLQGTAHDLAQKRRAVEIAGTTLGAEKVEDSLEVPTREP
jgi:osmotically-inducible protein OsmY